MYKILSSVLMASIAMGATAARADTTLTIASVNNPDLVTMQKYSSVFEEQTGIKLKWLLLDESTLRSRLTTDMNTRGGQFDVITIGDFETPLWAKQGWLTPLNDIPADYDLDDVVPSLRTALSYDGVLYSLPFYAESVITYYRTDLFKAAGITMPDNPTWSQIRDIAAKVDDRANGTYGICLRGQASQIISPIGAMANVFGGQLFDMNWKSGYDGDGWKKAAAFYVDLMQKYGPPGAVNNGFNENLALFASGHCAMWMDATVAAGMVYDPKRSQVADKVGFAAAPVETWNKGSGWLGIWAFSIPSSSPNADAAKKFIEWATSKSYINLMGEKEGWISVPPGTRRSTYANPDYEKVAPFADATLAAIEAADTIHTTKDPKPYIGITYADIPEMQPIGTYAGQQLAAALSGKMTADAALDAAAVYANRIMQQAGYQK